MWARYKSENGYSTLEFVARAIDKASFNCVYLRLTQECMHRKHIMVSRRYDESSPANQADQADPSS